MSKSQSRRLDKVAAAIANIGAATFSVGDVLAVGLVDGTCPIGVVEAIDSEFVRLVLMSALTGEFGVRTEIFRRVDIRRMVVAEIMEPDDHEPAGRKVFDTRPLGDFQTTWVSRHKAAT